MDLEVLSHVYLYLFGCIQLSWVFALGALGALEKNI